jgi:hypothetical protein
MGMSFVFYKILKRENLSAPFSLEDQQDLVAQSVSG